MALYDHVTALIEGAGLKPEDVRGITIEPGKITYRMWARNDNGAIASIASDIGDLPLSFEIVASYEPPHEHGPDTHTHDD